MFEWVFEVDDDVSSDDRGRITFSLEYEMTKKHKELYGSIENKVAARIQIQRDNTFTILPVVKVCIVLIIFLFVVAVFIFFAWTGDDDVMDRQITSCVEELLPGVGDGVLA